MVIPEACSEVNAAPPPYVQQTQTASRKSLRPPTMYESFDATMYDSPPRLDIGRKCGRRPSPLPNTARGGFEPPLAPWCRAVMPAAAVYSCITSFCVTARPPERACTKYTPGATSLPRESVPSQAVSCRPAGRTPSTKVFTSLPARSRTTSRTGPAAGSTYRTTARPRKGLAVVTRKHSCDPGSDPCLSSTPLPVPRTSRT